jgi:hypothetical protein
VKVFYLQEREPGERDYYWRRIDGEYDTPLAALEAADHRNANRPNDGRGWLKFRAVSESGDVLEYSERPIEL